jgi:nucleotide-binding universal stress UspA family protein
LFDNVFVGVDGRQGGRDAIALARQLASPEAGVTLAHVCGGSTAGGRFSSLAAPLELEDAERLLKRAIAEENLDADSAVVYESSVGRGLHQLTDERGADLLVVGSTRHALLGRIFMGDDCRAALNGSPCAVAVAARGYALSPHELLRLGVGYDDSPESAKALAAARALAKRYGSRIEVLWVITLPRVEEEAPIPADWERAIKDLEQQYSARLAELGDVEGHVTYGGPREELAQFAKQLDLLIVGSRSYGPVSRLIQGTVSGYLLSHASSSLLVLSRGGGAR